MPRFFLTPDKFENDSVVIDGENARHISRSLRMRAGDIVTLCDGESNEYVCRLDSFTDTQVFASVIEKKACESEPPYRVTLMQCLPKSDKMELVIQKAVELGVYRVIPVSSSRCIVKLDDASAPKKIQRWQKIADDAAGQCGRGILPKIEMPMSFADALRAAGDADLRMFMYEGEGEKSVSMAISTCDKTPSDIYVLIGSEGGFSEEEAAKARENGFVVTTLGKRILRTETAPLCVLSVISAFLEL